MNNPGDQIISAITNRNVELFDSMLATPEGVKCYDDNIFDYIDLIIKYNEIDFVKVLISRGLIYNPVVGICSPILDYAIGLKNTEIVKIILDSLPGPYEFSDGLFSSAVYTNSLDMLKLIYYHPNFKAEERDIYVRRHINIAIGNKNSEMVNMLYEIYASHGVDVNNCAERVR